MVQGKIIYDSTIWTRDEWERHLVNFKMGSRVRELNSSLIENQYFDNLQSHYFAILNNNPAEIRQKIICQVKNNLGGTPITEHAILDEGKNCEIYRISVSKTISISKKEIFNGSWGFGKSLHSKGPQAIRNLIERLESEVN